MNTDKFTQLIRFGPKTEFQKNRAAAYIYDLEPAENQEYEVTVKPYKKSKTHEQLGYYWGVVIPEFMEWQGCSSEEADQVMKETLVPPVIKSVMGHVIQVRVSIAKMKVNEMSKYIDLCINFLGSHDVRVPAPPYKDQ